MPFGKHKGTPLQELPSDYARWLLTQDYIRPDLRDVLSSLPDTSFSDAAERAPERKVTAPDALKPYIRSIVLEGYRVEMESFKDGPAAKIQAVKKARELLEETFDL